MTPTSEHVVSVFGAPIRFIGLSSRNLQRRLGLPALGAAQRNFFLTVKFVRNLNGFRNKGYSAKSSRRLLGNGFALDYGTRTLYYSLSARNRLRIAVRQAPHFMLTRTIVFALCLLDEMAKSHISTAPSLLYLHASAVATRKGVLIFCGESTFGKSTISGKLLKGFAKVDDDLTTIRLSGQPRNRPQVLLFGPVLSAARGNLPRGSKTARTLPVTAIFWLKKSLEFSIEPMDRAVFASRIISPMANWSQPQAVTHRLRLLRDLLKTVPCAELSFAKKSKPLIRFLRKKGYL